MRRSLCATALALAATAGEARACPVCTSETGARVRETLLGPDAPRDLVATLLPVPALLAAIALLHSGPPRPRPPEDSP